MIICRHFRLPEQVIHGCAAGRIAYVDCGPGCTVYEPDGEPSRRGEREIEAWAGPTNDDDQRPAVA